jgi:hypothetical protein
VRRVRNIELVPNGYQPTAQDTGSWIDADLCQIRINDDGSVDLGVFFKFPVDTDQFERLKLLHPRSEDVLRSYLRNHGPEKGEARYRTFLETLPEWRKDR